MKYITLYCHLVNGQNIAACMCPNRIAYANVCILWLESNHGIVCFKGPDRYGVWQQNEINRLYMTSQNQNICHQLLDGTQKWSDHTFVLSFYKGLKSKRWWVLSEVSISIASPVFRQLYHCLSTSEVTLKNTVMVGLYQNKGTIEL